MEIQDRVEPHRLLDQANHHVRLLFPLSQDVIPCDAEADGQLYRRNPVTPYPSGYHHVGPIQHQQLDFHGVHVHVSP
jgi:hypothetical protein